MLEDGGFAIILIKPQFETGEKKRFKNGIIKDENIRRTVCRSVYNCARETGFNVKDLTTAPIKDGKNVEYLLLLYKGSKNTEEFDKLYKNVR